MTKQLPNISAELQILATDVLKGIEEYNGKLSWRQLDRYLTSREENLSLLTNLMPIIKQFEADSLIQVDLSQSASEPKYWITENGRKFLQEN